MALASSCGDGEPTVPLAELDQLELDHGETVQDKNSLIEELTISLTEETATKKSLETNLETQATKLETALRKIERLETTNADIQDKVVAAEAEVLDLRTTYDPEIRAAAQLSWNEAIAAACESYGAGTGSVAQFVNHTDELGLIGSVSELEALVEECGDPIRDRTVDEVLAAECINADEDAIERNTSTFSGDCFVIYVVPFQWDSRTGACNFLGNYSGVNQGKRPYRYDGTALVRGGLTCPELDGMDQDDLLKMWVTLEGTYSYDTAAGGTNAVPEFSIRKAVLISKA